MEFDLQAFWARLRSLIRENRTTQRTLSEDIGLSPRTIETWMHKGTIPNASQLVLLADRLGVSVQYLVTGAEPPGQRPYPDMPDYEWLSPQRKASLLGFYRFQVQEQEQEFGTRSAEKMA